MIIVGNHSQLDKIKKPKSKVALQQLMKSVNILLEKQKVRTEKMKAQKKTNRNQKAKTKRKITSVSNKTTNDMQSSRKHFSSYFLKGSIFVRQGTYCYI